MNAEWPLVFDGHFFYLLFYKIKNVISVKEMKKMPITGRNLFPFCKINEKKVTILICFNILLIMSIVLNGYFGLYIACTIDKIIFNGWNRKKLI